MGSDLLGEAVQNVAMAEVGQAEIQGLMDWKLWREQINISPGLGFS